MHHLLGLLKLSDLLHKELFFVIGQVEQPVNKPVEVQDLLPIIALCIEPPGQGQFCLPASLDTTPRSLRV